MKREGRAKKKTGLRDSSKGDLGETDEGSVCERKRERERENEREHNLNLKTSNCTFLRKVDREENTISCMCLYVNLNYLNMRCTYK